MRRPTSAEQEHSIALLDHQGPSQRVGALLVATVSVVVGLLAGFAAGYAFALRLTMPVDASTPLRVVSANSQTPRDDRPTEAARGPNVVALPCRPMRRSSVPRLINSVATFDQHKTSAGDDANNWSRGRDRGHLSPWRQVLLDGMYWSCAAIDTGGCRRTHGVRVELAGFNPWMIAVRVRDGSRARGGRCWRWKGEVIVFRGT
jgi:hypothetical protein